MTNPIPIHGIPDASKFWQLQNHDPNGGDNCGPWAGAAVIAFDSSGKLYVTGTQIRAASNEPVPDPKDPGINMAQLVAAVNHFGVKLIFTKKIPIAELDASIDAGHGCVLFIDYAVIHGTAFSGQEDFVGLHAVARFPGDAILDPLADHRRPTVANGPQVWPRDLIHRAAGKYPFAGTGFAYAAITPHAFPLVVAPAPPAKPPVKPTVHTVTYLATGNVWEHSKADFSVASRVRVLKRGQRFLATGVHGKMATNGHVFVALSYLHKVG